MGQQKNVLAIAGFVLGLIGLLTSWLLFGALLCIPGIILSAVALPRSGNMGGKGLAIAGLVLSIIGVVVAHIAAVHRDSVLHAHFQRVAVLTLRLREQFATNIKVRKTSSTYCGCASSYVCRSLS